ncbi:hypothetical protein PG988_012567 [Apiospora saccharicola]
MTTTTTSTVTNGKHEPHNVSAILNYWDDPGDGSSPTPIYIGKGRITNERPHLPHRFTVSDVTGRESDFTLDGQGFQYLSHPSRLKEDDFANEQHIREEYYPECADRLKQATGASRVHIFNHKVRRGPTQWHHLGLKNLANRGPVTKTHVDQSYDGAELRMRWELSPEEAEDVVKKGKRYQIINVWRPIRTILKDPVAVADANTVPDSDLVSAIMVEDDYHGEQWVVRHNPAHKWYFKHGLTPDEVLLIKCFDSDTSVARRALHSAIEDPAYKDLESRQSIEVRCLVLYDD